MSKPNIEAKKERHKKLYEGQYHSYIGKLFFHGSRYVKSFWNKIKPSRRRFSHFMHPLDHLPAPRRLYTQLSIWSIGLLVVTSLNISAEAYEGGQGVGEEYLALENSSAVISDEEGYIIKSMPLEGVAVYDQNRNENINHTVQSGETLSVIAYRYGLATSSVRYANSSVGSGDRLKIGQDLIIPPKDGIYVEVKSGQSLVSLVEKYKGDLDKTKEFNNLIDDSELKTGEELFVMDGEPERVVIAAIPKSTGSSGGSFTTNSGASHYDLPVSADGWIRPTSGIITQGYWGYHLAYDVASRDKPPILTVAPGTVSKASAGTWGGGYGTHLIIDHGNGYKTLYAHMEEIYVNVGDYVGQGDVIGKMGNTGKVRGATGIHLHFEITYNGVKQSPSIMGVW